MCGIAVAIAWDGAEEAVRRLIDGLHHRGDVTDPIVSPARGFAMGTRRLRIVDSDKAIQPQPSFDGRILVSLNGEIYNHAELRRELESLGVVFRTASDTEVLASSLRIWGPKALERVNGMYAFVALDTANGEFLAARDPLGVKPLYLIQSGRGFLFCSEIRPLLEACDTGDVLLLPPGHRLTRATLVKFGAFVVDQAAAHRAHAPAVLDGLLAKAVHIRIPPDLPVATMFSGGIDSTLVTHYARQVRPEIPGYFLGDERAPDYEYAACYAERTGLDLRCVVANAHESLSTQIDDVVAAAESFEPSVIRNGLCNFLLSQRIHQDGFRVAMCGEGADELFAGYEPLELAFQDGDASGRNVREQALALMHRTNLQRVDRLGMRFQVEVREPFLDPAVIGYAMRLPVGALLGRTAGEVRGKAPLKSLWDLHRDDLPTAIRDRQKMPMNIGSGLDKNQKRSPWVEFAEETVSDRDFAEGKLRFKRFDLGAKEEFVYLDRLAATLDVFRVPHLTNRPFLKLPQMKIEQGVEKDLPNLVAGA